MKRKFIACTLAVGLGASLLAGCGTRLGHGAVTKGKKTKTAAGSYTEKKPYELTFAYIEFGTQTGEARQAVEDALNEYMVPNYHIRVDFLPLSEKTYAETLEGLILDAKQAENEKKRSKDESIIKPDVIPLAMTDASYWVTKGYVTDMADYMESEDGQKIVTALGADKAYVSKSGDRLIGFPANNQSIHLTGLCMRADICDDMGLTDRYGLSDNGDAYSENVVYSWEVATDILRSVKKYHPEVTPVYLRGNGSQLQTLAWFDTLEDDLGVLDWSADHTSTTVVNKYQTETYKQAAGRLATWNDAGLVNEDAVTATRPEADAMASGETFSYLTELAPGFIEDNQIENGIACYVMYFSQLAENGVSTTSLSAYDTSIASTSSDPEMAFHFISALYSDPVVMNLWQYGIEGINYEMNSDGTAHFTDGEDGTSYTYHMNSAEYMGNQFISYVWTNGEKSAAYWDELKSLESLASYSPAYGFMWDSAGYTAQLEVLEQVLETFRPALETGAIGGSDNLEATLDQLNRALYTAGLQEIMDAKQEQLNAWLEANGGPFEPAAEAEETN